MKKILLAIIVLISAAATVQAQRFGARVAFDVNAPVCNVGDMSNGTGFSFGGVYNIPLAQKLYFEPGLSFFYNTMTDKIPMQGPESDHAIPLIYNGTYKNCGFRVPLAVGYRMEITPLFDLSVYTGPQINYGLSMRYSLGNHSHNLYKDGYGHFDAQWLFGVRVHYLDNFFAEIGGGIGIGNILPAPAKENAHLRRNIASFAVGYMF